MSTEQNKIYNIGFFTSDYNRGLVSVVLDSLMSFLELHENVRVRVFDCFGFTNDRDGHSVTGEIYELPDLMTFDGVVVQSHQIVSDSALATLGERIRCSGIPAVSIGDFMEGITQINTDDYSAFREITEHLITEHGARRFLFLKGRERKGSGEAEARQKGFEDVCREHGIPKENIAFAGGSWMMKEGKMAARAILESGAPLPDAIVSANDEMALGAMGVLKKAGIRIPEDILVTGYDDVLSASLSSPRLATVRRDFKSLIFTAMEALRRMIRDGEKLPDLIYSPYQTVFAGSCGCYHSTTHELAFLKSSYYAHKRELTRFYTLQDKMTTELFAAREPGELLDVIEENAKIFGDGKMYICANERYHRDLFRGDNEFDKDAAHAGKFSSRFLLTACSDRTLKRDRDHVYARFARKDLLQQPFWSDEKFIIFYPLHFENLLMGFFALTTPPTTSDLNFHEVVMNLFEFAVENSRQRLMAKRLNERLNALYITDPLTGLYNRFGYERLAEELFFKIRGRGDRVHVLFIDIDDMKGINDRYGHEQGDEAIKTVARVMRNACRRDDFKMRFGGDEFVIITEEIDVSLKDRLVKSFEEVNRSGELSFELNVSVGEYIGTPEPGATLDEFLEKADREMYRVKTARKGEPSETSF